MTKFKIDTPIYAGEVVDYESYKRLEYAVRCVVDHWEQNQLISPHEMYMVCKRALEPKKVESQMNEIDKFLWDKNRK